MSREKTIRIYFGDKLLLVSDEKNIKGDDLFYESGSLSEALQKLDKSVHGVEYKTTSVKKTFNDLLAFFSLIEAAGGLVTNPEGRFLVIFRHNKWDLPKGKKDPGESDEETALREVEEECGLKELKILRSLPATYHTYAHKGKNILKKTSWFEMSCTRWDNLNLQAEEDITDARWMTKEEIKNSVLQNTYASVRHLLKEFLIV